MMNDRGKRSKRDVEDASGRLTGVLHQKRQDGFGLLELLIAMTILAIGMLGIMKLQMQSGFGNTASRQQSAAVNLARSKMEELRRIGVWTVQPDHAFGYTVWPQIDDTDTSNDLADWNNPDWEEGPLGESEDSGVGGQIYTRAWNVVHDYPIPGFKTVRIRVSWVANGVEKHVDLETQIGRKDADYFE